MSRLTSPYILGLVRPVADKANDASALAAIAQAAVDVEMFTIPLYMGTLYSIQGTHQITGTNEFYKGRWWPGPGTTSEPTSPNDHAFNLIYSVFIEEMLHLQMAANIASALGVKPTFTSLSPRPDLAWTCYGDGKTEQTVIPNIVDLRSTKSYADVVVRIGALDQNQAKLFLAIEEPEAVARRELGADPDDDVPVATGAAGGEYFPTVPFDGWDPSKPFNRLPMFGTIGWMYQCFYDYLNLRYADGSTLWEFMSSPRQKDMFNTISAWHQPEYPGFAPSLSSSAQALADIVVMMDAITDQGEGSELEKRVPNDTLAAVKPRYQASKEALEKDYPKYDDSGGSAKSSDAVARTEYGAADHYERFEELAKMLDEVVTWPQWFEKRGNRPWTTEDLEPTPGDASANPYDLPTAEQIVDALNNMGDRSEANAKHRADMASTINEAVTGSIAGITTVLNNYWSALDVSFPYPSMVGSGDRMAIYWAVFGEAPQLWQPVPQVDPDKLNHACQGLDLRAVGASCAVPGIYHACRGSNSCRTQGGCGFVQKTTSRGQGCHPVLMGARVVLVDDTDEPILFSAPADNKCAGFGGCAAPISASQLMPVVNDSDGNPISPVTIQLFDFAGSNMAKAVGTITFKTGEKVHDVAYRAYLEVLKLRGDGPMPDPNPPAANEIRLVFSPST
jgi:Ferritin-like